MRHSHETGASGISDAGRQLLQITGSQTAVYFYDSESETYDADIGGKKEELKEEAKAEEQRHIAEMNQKMQIIELEKRMKQNAVLRDKARAEEEFQEEKTKLDRALAMDVISRDEYNFKISIARKKVDNFEEIRKIEQQFDMGIITKEEKNAKIAALTQ